MASTRTTKPTGAKRPGMLFPFRNPRTSGIPEPAQIGAKTLTRLVATAAKPTQKPTSTIVPGMRPTLFITSCAVLNFRSTRTKSVSTMTWFTAATMTGMRNVTPAVT